MYNILGLIFSKTDDKKEKIDMVGAKYVTKTQDADIAKEMDDQQDALEKLSASSEIPKAYTVAKGILLLLSIALIFGSIALISASFFTSFFCLRLLPI